MSKRILIIDDDMAIRKAIVLALEDTNYQVDTAASGEEGIKKERSMSYDLILLDLKMPVMDGVETLRNIRKVNKEIPVYIITAFYKEFLSDLKIVENEGIEFQLLKKPIDSEQILAAVKGILDGPIVY